MLFTTGDCFDGHRVTAWLGICSAEQLIQPSLSRQGDKLDAARAALLEDLAKKIPAADGILAIRLEHAPVLRQLLHLRHRHRRLSGPPLSQSADIFTSPPPRSEISIPCSLSLVF